MSQPSLPAEEQPLVSVIIPTYNRARLLLRAVKSALSQTYARLEVLVIDDASTDETAVVLTDQVNDVRLSYIRQPQNRGGAAARNRGLALAKGEYVAFLDSDDTWMPEKIERQVECFEQQSEPGAVYCRYLMVDHVGRAYQMDDVLYQGWVRPRLIRGWCPASTSLFVVRRTSLEAVGGFDEKLPSFQDYDLWLRLAEHFPFRAVNATLARFYHHNEARVSINIEGRRRGFQLFLEKWDSVFRQELTPAEYETLKSSYAAQFYINAATQAFHQGRSRDGQQFLWQAWRITPQNRELALKLGIALLGGWRLYNALGAMRNRRLLVKG